MSMIYAGSQDSSMINADLLPRRNISASDLSQSYHDIAVAGCTEIPSRQIAPYLLLPSLPSTKQPRRWNDRECSVRGKSFVLVHAHCRVSLAMTRSQCDGGGEALTWSNYGQLSCVVVTMAAAYRLLENRFRQL